MKLSVGENPLNRSAMRPEMDGDMIYSIWKHVVSRKEIYFIKTGVRWQISAGLRKHLKKLPYFMLYNYPKKLNKYNYIKYLNTTRDEDEQTPYNAYRSPSPMNELCE